MFVCYININILHERWLLWLDSLFVSNTKELIDPASFCGASGCYPSMGIAMGITMGIAIRWSSISSIFLPCVCGGRDSLQSVFFLKLINKQWMTENFLYIVRRIYDYAHTKTRGTLPPNLYRNQIRRKDSRVSWNPCSAQRRSRYYGSPRRLECTTIRPPRCGAIDKDDKGS